MRQEPKRAVARLVDGAREAGLFGENLERQENLKIHGCRRHVRAWAEVSPRYLAAGRTWPWIATRGHPSIRTSQRSAPAWPGVRAGRVVLLPSLRRSYRSCRARFPDSL